GLRIGELAGLRWSDLDLERGLLRLKDTSRKARKSKRQQARTTKSHRDRTLPLHEELRAILERLPRQADGRVFHGPQGASSSPTRYGTSSSAKYCLRWPSSSRPVAMTRGSWRADCTASVTTSARCRQTRMCRSRCSWLGWATGTPVLVRHDYHLRQDE